jgi:hypothetical protein
MLKRCFNLLGLFCLISLSSCIFNNDGEDEPKPSSAPLGEVIDIPGIEIPGAGSSLELKTTNEGLYMHVSKFEDDSEWIYRLQIGGASPNWIFHRQPSIYFNWQPSNETTENPDDFAIFFSTIEKNGFVNINTGLPALLEEDNPYNNGFSFTGHLLVDNSFLASEWAFFGSTVKIRQNNNLNKYDVICTLPEAGGVNIVEADPEDAVVWAGAGKKLHKITVNGDITTFDVSAFADPDFVLGSIDKIRFSEDDVFFKAENKVFIVEGGTDLRLFYTINNGANFMGGDFAVDNSYMYASDGVKKQIGLLTETSFVGEAPDPSNTQDYMDYITQLNYLNTGQLETSKSATDGDLYVLAQNRILVIPKSRL